MRLMPRNLFVYPAVCVDSAARGETRLRVDGMVCDACARRVRAALAGLPGVKSASVDLTSGTAVVHTDSGFDSAAATRAVEDAVILRRARALLARAPGLGRRP